MRDTCVNKACELICFKNSAYEIGIKFAGSKNECLLVRRSCDYIDYSFKLKIIITVFFHGFKYVGTNAT